LILCLIDLLIMMDVWFNDIFIINWFKERLISLKIDLMKDWFKKILIQEKSDLIKDWFNKRLI